MDCDAHEEHDRACLANAKLNGTQQRGLREDQREMVQPGLLNVSIVTCFCVSVYIFSFFHKKIFLKLQYLPIHLSPLYPRVW